MVKKTIRARLFLAIAGLVITVAGFAATCIYNWDDCAEISFEFP